MAAYAELVVADLVAVHRALDLGSMAAYAELVVALQQLGRANSLPAVVPALRLLRRVLVAVELVARTAHGGGQQRKRRADPMELERIVSTLPPRQRQVLEGLKAGRSEKEVAGQLRISAHTVHIYIKAIYRRFQVSTRGELLSLWMSEPFCAREAGHHARGSGDGSRDSDRPTE